MASVDHGPISWFKENVLSLWTDRTARANFASRDPEVTKQRVLLDQRSVASNFGLLVTGVTPYENIIRTGSFDRAALYSSIYKTIANPIFATHISDWLNQYVVGWSNFRTKEDAGRSLDRLAALQKSASDTDGAVLAGQIHAVRQGTLMRLFRSQQGVQDILTRGQNGENLSPRESVELSEHFALRSELLREMADFKEGKRAPATTHLFSPDELVKETEAAINKQGALNAREAQLVLGVAAALLVDAIPTVGRIEFIPYDQRALYGSDIKVLERTILNIPASASAQEAAQTISSAIGKDLKMDATRRLAFMRTHLNMIDSKLEQSNAR